MIKFVLMKIRLNIFRCFVCSTYFLIFMQQDFILCTINNSILLLLSVKFLSWYGIVPTVLVRSDFNIIRTKCSQDLLFIRWMPGAMYETGFWLTLWVSYIFFCAWHLSHSPWIKYATKRLLLSFACCDHNGWNTP